MEYLLTIIGAFILPFSILSIWGRFISRFGAIGGWIAAFLIIGPVWFLNHGMAYPLIHQSSHVFVDMGLATAVGIFVYGLRSDIPYANHRLTIYASLIGGAVAGIILSIC